MVYIRKNQKNLTKAEKRAFVNAVLELKRRGRYDRFVRTHIEYFVGDGDEGLRVAHMAPSFLPWHRRFLLDFENELRKVNPKVTVPYWDWTRDNSPSSSLWAEDFMGGTGRGEDLQVTTGPFAHRHGNWTIETAVTEDPFLTRDLANAHGRGGRMDLPPREDLNRALADSVYDVAPWNSLSPTGFRNKMEGWTDGKRTDTMRTHNRVHRWIGGTMIGGGAVNDPVFWLHHAFVDLIWSRWQARHPKSGYRPARPPGRDDPQRGRVAALNERMPPWHTTPAALLDHSKIYKYAD
ncbi:MULTISPECIES: tyrosinase family protein [unclassified Streptomyces]|uniref:tyrosinase family protein n=1 Tax=unclassified Streptomyces TaxID=2593676 RepID=UPI0033FECD99